MAGSSVTLIVSLGVLLMISAFFSATETAFTSFNTFRLKNERAHGNRKAALVLELAEDYDRVLTTLLIGNNVVNITTASIGTVIFTRSLGEFGVTVSTIVVTLLVLTFSEIFPKTFAKQGADQFAMLAAPIVRILIVILAPLNGFYAWIKGLLARRLSVSRNERITEEELLTIVQEAQSVGGIKEQEGDLIRSVFEFDDLEAGDILTPRVDVVAVSDEATTEEILEVFRRSGYSRLPVYRGSVDEIVGIINHKDFHNEVVQSGKPIPSITQPAAFVPASTKLDTLLVQLQQNKSHIAVVVDEFGGTVGIVTMEDILEELVGEIWDEHDRVVDDIRKTGENEYRVMASTSLEKFFRTLGVRDEETEASTVGGWAIEQLGRVSEEGDMFDFENLSITVSKTSSRRILETRILVHSDSRKSD